MEYIILSMRMDCAVSFRQISITLFPFILSLIVP